MKYDIHDLVCDGDITGLKRALRDRDVRRFINTPDPERDYLSPVHLACDIGDPKILRLLIQNGGDVHQILPEESQQSHKPSEEDLRYAPMHFAAQCDNDCVELVTILVQNGADINKSLSCGTTPLHAAVSRRNIKTVQKLLDLGALIFPRHGRGFTSALEDSERTGDESLRKVLFDRCQTCGYAGRETSPIHPCECNRVQYCSIECASADTVFHKNLCRYVTLNPPRFSIGTCVKCVITDRQNVDQFQDGRVVRTWYKQHNFKEGTYAPYQIRLDKCGSMIYAPQDTDNHIQIADGKGQQLNNLVSFSFYKKMWKRMKRARREKIGHLVQWKTIETNLSDED